MEVENEMDADDDDGDKVKGTMKRFHVHARGWSLYSSAYTT